MRRARIVEDGPAYYHIMSRVVDRRFVFDEGERERIRKTLRAVEGFSGCEVRTYAVLSNHWHVHLYVPERQEITNGELARRMGFLYNRTVVEMVPGHLAQLRASGNQDAAEALKGEYTRRMFCGYGEAMGGSSLARAGISRVMREGEMTPEWGEASARYREWTYLAGEQKGLQENGMPT